MAGMQGIETRQFLHQEHRSAAKITFLRGYQALVTKPSWDGLLHVASEMLLLPCPDGLH